METGDLSSSESLLEDSKTADAEQCFHRCQGTKVCKGFTWFKVDHPVTSQRGHCHLVSSLKDHINNDFAVSGILENCFATIEPLYAQPNYWTGQPGDSWTEEEALIVKAKLYMLMMTSGSVVNEQAILHHTKLKPRCQIH